MGDQVVEGLRVVNNQTGEKEDISITGLFIAIGHKPNTDIFKGQLDMDETGTSLPRVNLPRPISREYSQVEMPRTKNTDKL